MNLQPVYGERALYWKDENAIIVADLHIGMEFEFREHGINIPFQTDRMAERCERLIESTGAERIIILGDLKHMIAGKEQLMEERKHVSIFLKRLSEKVEIVLVKGNHDGSIRSRRMKIYGPRGIKIGEVFLFHGHAWPGKEIADVSIAIASHLHPHVKIVNELGYSYIQPCWVRGKMKKEIMKKRYGREKKMEFIIMPAFNEIAGGVAINESMPEKVFSMMDMDNANVFSLEGINFGRIRNLRYTHIMHGEKNEGADN